MMFPTATVNNQAAWSTDFMLEGAYRGHKFVSKQTPYTTLMPHASNQKTSPTKTSPTKFSYHIDSGDGNNVQSNNKMELLTEYFNSLYHNLHYNPKG